MSKEQHDGSAGDVRKRADHRSLPERAFRRGWMIIVLGALIAGGLAFSQLLMVPTRHVAEAKLLYRFGREYFPITPAEVRRNWGENIIIPLDIALATEMHLLASHEVAAEAVAALDSTFAPPVTGKSENVGAAVDRVAAFSDLVEVRRVQGATMLSITVEYTDPQVAERMLDTFLSSYLKRRDELFYADARAYFEEQTAALRAKDDAIQEELGRMNIEYSDLELQNSMTEWSPDQPVGESDQKTDEIQAKLAWMQGVIEQQAKRSAAVRDLLIELEREQADWEISRAYTQMVAPVVEIIDKVPVRKTDGRMRSLTRILAAAIAGALAVWVCFMAVLLVRNYATERSS